MKGWLRQFTTRGRTVFFTTHVLEAAERLCDTVAIIRKGGQVVWEGDISPLATDGHIVVGDRRFETLESLFPPDRRTVRGTQLAVEKRARWSRVRRVRGFAIQRCSRRCSASAPNAASICAYE